MFNHIFGGGGGGEGEAWGCEIVCMLVCVCGGREGEDRVRYVMHY